MVGGVRQGEEGDIHICKLDGGSRVGNVGFVNLIEWRPGEGRSGRGGHLIDSQLQYWETVLML